MAVAFSRLSGLDYKMGVVLGRFVFCDYKINIGTIENFRNVLKFTVSCKSEKSEFRIK